MVLGLLLSNSAFPDKRFKDIKSLKKQSISMFSKKVNRIKQVKESGGFSVYEKNTSIQVTDVTDPS